MNFVVAPDSFKGSLRALEAAEAMTQGILAVCPEAEIVSLPLADGGEGTAEALVMATRGRLQEVRVTGPLGEPVTALLGLLGDDVTAVVECAQACGLPLVPPERRNPLHTTTRAAWGNSCSRRSTQDAPDSSSAWAAARPTTAGREWRTRSGARLLDAQGRELPPGAEALERLARIDVSHLDPRLAEVTVWGASDVTNPLCGPEGASAVYGPQKGASPAMVEFLDRTLSHYADIITRDLDLDVRYFSGAGAAGGLGTGLLAFAHATLRSGASLVLEMFHFEDLLEAADLVFTGEGKIDSQLAFGKAVGTVALLAQKHGVPVVAFAGSVHVEPEQLWECGLQAAVPILSSPMEEREAMARAGELLQKAVERTVRILQLGETIAEKWGR